MTEAMMSQDHSRGFSKLKFLVVDDFENFRRSLKQMLKTFGAEHIDTASNGKEAVYKCTYDRYDVVLCDYNMGDAKNGQQVLEELRHKKLLRQTAVFALITAETSRDIVMSAREHQPDTYITKPITRALLEKRMQALIEQRQALYPINHELDLENPPRAISLCNELLPKLPRYRNWLFRTLADLYYRTGDYSHAHKVYEEVLASRDIGWARLGAAKVLIAEQKWDQAVSQLEQLIAKTPDYVEAYDWLAQAQQGKGQDRRAQKTLEEATRISPKAILRQQHLARVSTRNQDLETAAEAWRNTVKLSDHSVHSNAEHYLNLGRCLSDLSEGDSSEQGRKNAEEALKTLQQMQQRFRDDSAETNSTLIAARVHAGQNRERESRQLLEKVRDAIDPQAVDAATGLETARTLYSMGDTTAAQELLTVLAGRFEDDSAVMKEIEALLDEPVSMGKKIQARAANREGIAAFETGRLDEAADAFARALELVPQHPALNLNLVQILLKKAESEPGGVDATTLQRCMSNLDRIAHLPPQHRQYQRYLSLRKKVTGLKQSR
jgi:CheY-like chemotaxis protein